MRSSIWLWLVAVVWVGCAQELPHDAPYDPASPSEKQARATVTGKVSLEGETDHAGIGVSLQNGARTYTVQTEGSGQFSLTGVVPGTYSVHAETRFFAARETTLLVQLGAVADLGSLVLSAKRAAVKGSALAERIDGRSSRVEGGVSIMLLRKGSVRGAQAKAPTLRTSADDGGVSGESYTAVSESDGEYLFDSIPVGVYTVVATSDDLSSEAVSDLTITGTDAVVSAGEIVLRPITGFIDVVGDAGGTPSALYTSSSTVTLKLVGINAVQMALGTSGTGFEADCAFDAPRAYDAIVAYALPPGDGRATVCVKFIDETGRESKIATASIVVDATPPAGATIMVDGGSATVNAVSGAVALTLSAWDGGTGVQSMKLANRGPSTNTCPGQLAGVVAEPFAVGEPWYLDAPGNGLEGYRTVCAAFADAAGNWSAPVSDTVFYDTQPPVAWNGGLVIESGATYATRTLVQLDLPVTGASQMMLANDAAFTGSAWEPFRATTAWYLPAAQGPHTVWVQFRDEAGNLAGPFSVPIMLDTLAPTAPAVLIDGGAAYAVTTAVGLTLSASGATRMQLSNDGVFDTEPVEPYATLVTDWALQAGDGVKAVYARYLDEAGNASAVASALVTLDMTPPSDGSLAINGGAAYTQLPVVALQLASVGVSEMAVAEGACPGAGATWVSYAPTAAFTLTLVDDLHTLFARYRDQAGNLSTCVSASTTLDRSFGDTPSASLTGIEGIPGKTRNMYVTLHLAGLGADSFEVQLANDSGFAGSSWLPVTASTGWQLTVGDGAKTVYARLRDRAGNLSTTLTPSLTLDTTGPDSPGLTVIDIDGDGYAVSSTTVEIQWSAPADAAGYEVQRYVQYRDPGFVPLVGTGPGTTEYLDFVTTTTGYLHYYRVRAYDDLGNLSGWSVMADAAPFMPIDRIRAVQTDWGMHYDFIPLKGTFSLHPWHTYTDMNGYEVHDDLNTDTIYWDRATASTLIFNDMLHLKLLNNDGTVAYRSDFKLDLHTRETLMGQGQFSAMRTDRQGHIHFGGWGNVPVGDGSNTEKGVYYAHDITGSLHWEFVDADASHNPASTARTVDLALDGFDQPHLVAIRTYANMSGVVTGASLLYYRQVGANWMAEVVTSTTSQINSTQMHPRVVIDRNGEPVLAYAMVFAPSTWPFKVYGARKVGGVWTSTYVADGDNPALAIDAANNAAVAINYVGGYFVEAGAIWNYYALETTVSVSYPELVTDVAGNLHAVYFSPNDKQLIYANNVTGTWNRQVLQTGVNGNYSGLSLDANGTAHIAFAAYGAGEQQYWTNDSGTWAKTVYDMDANQGVGYRSTALTPAGLRILYYHAMAGELRLLKLGHEQLKKDVVASPSFSPNGMGAAIAGDGSLYAAYSGYQPFYGYVATWMTNRTGPWTTLLTVRPTGPATDVGVTVDANDNVHLFYTRYGFGVYYANAATGTFAWVLADTGYYPSTPRMLVDATGNVHITYTGTPVTGGTSILRHTLITPPGDIRNDSGPAASGFASLAVSADGTEHFAYSDSTRAVWYRTHSAGGGWSPPQLVTTWGGIQGTIALDPAEKPHMVFVRLGDMTLQYAALEADGWHGTTLDDTGDVGRQCTLAFDAAGIGHVLQVDKGSGTMKYASNENGAWMHTRLVPLKQLRYLPVLFGPQGEVHTVYLSRTNEIVHIADFVKFIDASSVGRASAW